MVERREQNASLAGRVVRDLSFEPVDPSAFTAEVTGWPHKPQYKRGGFFIFSDLPAGEHTLILSGSRLQSRSLPLTLPLASTLLEAPGDDELAVVVSQVDGSRISFPAVELPRPIRAGSRVLSAGASTTLAKALDAGTATFAQLASVAGISTGDVVRVVRDPAVRLRHDPYSTVPHGMTRIVGRIGEVADPNEGIPEMTVRLTQVNGEAVAVNDIAGAALATVELGSVRHLLGTAGDLAAVTNAKGDYNFYFAADFINHVTLEISGAGFQTRTEVLAVTQDQRTKADFTLSRV